jgi:hypothetical protein
MSEIKYADAVADDFKGLHATDRQRILDRKAQLTLTDQTNSKTRNSWGFGSAFDK